MSDRTIFVTAADDVTITRDDGTPTNQQDILQSALYGNAFSWESPNDLQITLSGPQVAITFDDADGVLQDNPFSGGEVVDQQLTQSVTIDGETYEPSAETVRWMDPPSVNVEAEYRVTLFDDVGTAYEMIGVSITEGYSTDVVGVTFDGPSPPPGTTLNYIQGVSSYSWTADGGMTIPDEVPCFLAGTLIETPRGSCRIEDLREGDMVMTLDNGAQPIRWIGSSTVCGLGSLAPVRIAAGWLGNTRDLFVSPNHRVLLRSAAAELNCGHLTVLATAKSLDGHPHVSRVQMRRAEYLHILLDEHQMVFSEGLATESLFAGAVESGALGADAVTELKEIFPQIRMQPTALRYPALSSWEARLLVRQSCSGVGVAGLTRATNASEATASAA